MRLLMLTGILLTLHSHSRAQYLIEGKMAQPDTQMVAYLNILNRWNEFDYIAEYMILKAAPIQADGSFRFEGNELAEEIGFYKIHFSDPNYTAVYRTGDPEAKNYFHFLLSNHDTVSVEISGYKHAPGEVHMRSSIAENERIAAYTAQVYELRAQEKKSDMPHHLELIDQKRAGFAQEKLQAESHGLVNLFLLYLGQLDIAAHPEAFDQVAKQLDDSRFRPEYHQTLLEHVGSKRYPEIWEQNKTLKRIVFLLLVLIGSLIFLAFWQKKRISSLTKAQLSPIDYTKHLTTKEEEVALLIGQRLTNKEIAAQLHISEATVKTHVNSIYRKTPFSNRRELQQNFQNSSQKD